ncbi:hypothetical protein Hanom_Chr10g00942651 [Helianthus anomalus]
MGCYNLAGKTSFEKHELHVEFIERGYEGQLKEVKTTAFNEISLKIQHLGYAILINFDFNYSQALFSDLVTNVKNVKKGANNVFLMYPRLLSYYLQKQVSQKDFQQGVVFQINSLTSETFTCLMAKESTVSKTKAKGNEPVLDELTYVAQTFVAKPTAHGDHDTTTGVVKPTPAKPKKKPVKSKKPTKTNKKGPLEDEIPEVNPVTTQMSLETTTATSSQLLVRSPTKQTPHESSQKDHVVSTGIPHQEAELSLESMLKIPSPRAMSLSTPQRSPQIPSTIIPLFKEIEIQTRISPSHSPIIESTLPQMTDSEQLKSAIPRTAEEAIPP